MNRILFIDIAKGISILLVVLGHELWLYNEMSRTNNLLSMLRMPFFFFISGVFFSTQKPFFSYLTYKFDTLIKPYLFMAILILVFSLIFGSALRESLINALLMLYAGRYLGWPWTPMWFLTHLWVVFVFSLFILKLVKYETKDIYFKAVFLFVLALLGSHVITFFWPFEVYYSGSNHEVSGLPFSLDLVLLTSFYFILGFSLKNYIYNFKANYLLFLIGAAIMYLSAFHLGTSIKLNDRVVNNALFAIPTSLVAVYCALVISVLISKTAYFSKLFLKMGAHSLFILIFHAPVHHYISIYLWPGNSGIKTITLLIVSIIIPIFMGMIISNNAYLALFFKPIRHNKLFKKAETV